MIVPADCSSKSRPSPVYIVARRMLHYTDARRTAAAMTSAHPRAWSDMVLLTDESAFREQMTDALTSIRKISVSSFTWKRIVDHLGEDWITPNLVVRWVPHFVEVLTTVKPSSYLRSRSLPSPVGPIRKKDTAPEEDVIVYVVCLEKAGETGHP